VNERFFVSKMIEFEESSWTEQSLMPPSPLLFMSISRDDDEDQLLLPLPSQPHQRESSFSRRQLPRLGEDVVTGNAAPLGKEQSQHRRKRRIPSGPIESSSVLFGAHQLDWEQRNTPKSFNATPKGMANYLFGFMMEDLSDGRSISKNSEPEISTWNRLNIALFVAVTLTTAATAVPVTLIPTVGRSLGLDSVFSSRATESAVLGTAIGKFFNGPLADLVGARRVSLANSIFLAVSLMFLSISWNESSVLWACFLIEFFQSVQWPCVIVILAQHYGSKDKEFEASVYVASLAPRFGRLLSIPLASLLLRTLSWRIVVNIGSALAMLGVLVIYYCVRDSPCEWHEAQNPISVLHFQQLEQQLLTSLPLWTNIMGLLSFSQNVIRDNVLPALRMLLTQKTFWIVAFAHSGDTMVQSSQRVLGSYFQDTSFGTISENRAGGLSIMLSFGLIAGLAMAGGIFTRAMPKKRKQLLSKLYLLTVVSCYLLGLLAIPRLRVLVGEPGLILCMQVIVTFFMGLGIAVQSYIPGLVGATNGKSKGLFCSYTDGVAYAVSSWVWKVVSNAVHSGNSEGGGWAYGWAAVALLEILCAVVMVEFMDHYFARRGAAMNEQGNREKVDEGGYETILFM